MRLLRSLFALSLSLSFSLSHGKEAAADLIDDVDRLAQKWSDRKGTIVERHPAVFLEHGRLSVLHLHKTAGESAVQATPAQTVSESANPPTSNAPKANDAPKAAGTLPASACITIAVIAPRTSEIAFLTEKEGTAQALPTELPPGENSADSTDGVLRTKGGVGLFERCEKSGKASPVPERLLLQSQSPRTAVQVLVAYSDAPIERIENILPERALGPSAPRGNAGRPLDPGPIDERIARAEKRARDLAAEKVVKVAMRASATGTGIFAARLAEGCHSLDVLAETLPSSARATDIDVEARSTEDSRQLGRDRGESPDAHVEFCLGEPQEVNVSFIGAAGPAEVTLVDALWSIPASVPSEWGAHARGDIALALRRRHTPTLPAEPIQTIMGVQGETLIPITVEPGECYVALVALIRGENRATRLTVELGDRAPHDEIGERPEAAQVAFCSKTEDRAALRVEARGTQPWWLGLVYRVTR